MASKGPMPKHPSKRQRKNKPPALSVVATVGLTKPKYERQWVAVTRLAWDAFWDADVSQIVAAEDVFTLRRLFNLRDDHERLTRAARKTPLLQGSQGQMVENPAAKRADRLMGHISQLEDKFGLSPGARLRLLLSSADVQRTVSDLEKGMQGDDDLQIIDVD